MRQRTRTVLSRVAAASFEAFVMVLLLIEAIGFVCGGQQPGSVRHTFPAWLQDTWGWALLAGTILTLAGMAAARQVIHAAGLLFVGWVALTFGVAVIAHAQPGSLIQAILDIALAALCVFRATQLQRRP